MLGAACATPRAVGPASEAAEQIRKVLPKGWSVFNSSDYVTVKRNKRVLRMWPQPINPKTDVVPETFSITLTFSEVITETELQHIKERRAWLNSEDKRLRKEQADDYNKLRAVGDTDFRAAVLSMNTYEPLIAGVERALGRVRLPFGRTTRHTVWAWVSPDIRQVAPRTVSEECTGVLKKIRSRFIAYEDDEK